MADRPTLPPDSVRGRIAAYLARQTIVAPVLELGSRFPDPSAWWADNRHLAEGGEWVGVDSEAGANVDVVVDASSLPPELRDRFATVVCSEMLEHVTDPLAVLRSAHSALRVGGRIVVTTLFAFPVHNHPADYWRFSEQGLRSLLVAAGFDQVRTESAGEIRVTLDDHGGQLVEKVIPMHTFATGVKA